MSQSFQYTGNLEETSLTDMLALILRHRVPGVMQISKSGCVKHIYVSGGNVVHAASTEKKDWLGAYLHREGLLSQEDLAETMREREISDKRHGQLILERGLLSPKELYEAIRGQMEAIVWSVFAWRTGKVSFKIGEVEKEGQIRIQLPMRQVIVRGIKKVVDTKSLVSRLGKKSTIFSPIYCTEDLIELALESDEYKLLSLVDGQRLFYDICNMGPFSMSENARLIYAFRLLGLVEQTDSDTESGTGGVMIRMGGKAV